MADAQQYGANIPAGTAQTDVQTVTIAPALAAPVLIKQEDMSHSPQTVVPEPAETSAVVAAIPAGTMQAAEAAGNPAATAATMPGIGTLAPEVNHGDEVVKAAAEFERQSRKMKGQITVKAEAEPGMTDLPHPPVVPEMGKSVGVTARTYVRPDEKDRTEWADVQAEKLKKEKETKSKKRKRDDAEKSAAAKQQLEEINKNKKTADQGTDGGSKPKKKAKKTNNQNAAADSTQIHHQTATPTQTHSSAQTPPAAIVQQLTPQQQQQLQQQQQHQQVVPVSGDQLQFMHLSDDIRDSLDLLSPDQKASEYYSGEFQSTEFNESKPLADLLLNQNMVSYSQDGTLLSQGGAVLGTSQMIAQAYNQAQQLSSSTPMSQQQLLASAGLAGQMAGQMGITIIPAQPTATQDGQTSLSEGQATTLVADESQGSGGGGATIQTINGTTYTAGSMVACGSSSSVLAAVGELVDTGIPTGAERDHCVPRDCSTGRELHVHVHGDGRCGNRHGSEHRHRGSRAAWGLHCEAGDAGGTGTDAGPGLAERPADTGPRGQRDHGDLGLPTHRHTERRDQRGLHPPASLRHHPHLRRGRGQQGHHHHIQEPDRGHPGARGRHHSDTGRHAARVPGAAPGSFLPQLQNMGVGAATAATHTPAAAAPPSPSLLQMSAKVDKMLVMMQETVRAITEANKRLDRLESQLAQNAPKSKKKQSTSTSSTSSSTATTATSSSAATSAASPGQSKSDLKASLADYLTITGFNNKDELKRESSSDLFIPVGTVSLPVAETPSPSGETATSTVSELPDQNLLVLNNAAPVPIAAAAGSEVTVPDVAAAPDSQSGIAVTIYDSEGGTYELGPDSSKDTAGARFTTVSQNPKTVIVDPKFWEMLVEDFQKNMTSKQIMSALANIRKPLVRNMGNNEISICSSVLKEAEEACQGRRERLAKELVFRIFTLGEVYDRNVSGVFYIKGKKMENKHKALDPAKMSAIRFLVMRYPPSVLDNPRLEKLVWKNCVDRINDALRRIYNWIHKLVDINSIIDKLPTQHSQPVLQSP
ncbi:LOW QUALITY PROTEIN: uncharacterized protein LOC143275240 [Babylonia areolata]|uniref:LOW QUALITY PROTEIN: uncharacterized protein LOC143275240 n=1 Tax=Babylonia areolata TaxID=304850 RepID=UPI003FD1DE9E